MHILSRLGATTVDLSPISEEVLCKSYTLSPVPPNCWHVAGHEPIWGAMTNLAFAAKLPADFRRLDGCRGLRSRTKRGLSDLGFFSAGGDAAGASKPTGRIHPRQDAAVVHRRARRSR